MKCPLCNVLGMKTRPLSPSVWKIRGLLVLANNTSINARNKYIHIRHHFVPDVVDRKVICLTYCPTADKAAEILTKPHLRVVFEKFHALMGTC